MMKGEKEKIIDAGVLFNTAVAYSIVLIHLIIDAGRQLCVCVCACVANALAIIYVIPLPCMCVYACTIKALNATTV